MKYILFVVFLLGICIPMYSGASINQITEAAGKITWFGQSAFKIRSQGKIICIDPYLIKDNDSADLILITHSHFDHFDKPSIAKIMSTNTIILAPADIAGELGNNAVPVRPGMDTNIAGINIETVPAYNAVKKSYHPKSKNWVGYILTVNGVRIYHTGDTERIPEMKNIKCDIILVPLGQTYTMNSVREAADAVLDVKAKIAIPMHYGMYEGTPDDAVQFAKILKGKVRVILLESKK